MPKKKPVEKTPPKKVAKKPVKKVVAKVEPEMVSYAMKMVIPTGQYANIQPEIVVKAGSVEEAHNFIAPHMNKLWKEYFLINERRPEPPVVQAVPPKPEITPPPTNQVPRKITPPPTLKPSVATEPPAPAEDNGLKLATTATAPPVVSEPTVTAPPTPPPSSVALVKATNAIESCTSLAAFEMIMTQIDKSVKLTEEDKEMLIPLLAEKSKLLSTPIQ